ncbi:MAG: zinc ribbon domain-containing protein [Candidatus Zixiibacteriota bacterium]
MSSDRKECPNCAVEVEGGKENCPICGYEFSQVKSRHHLFTWVAVILIVLFIIPLLIFVFRVFR